MNWCAPDSWVSEYPVVFKGLDNDENLQLMNGAQIVPGKVSGMTSKNPDSPCQIHTKWQQN